MTLDLVEAVARGLPANYLGLLSTKVIKMHYDQAAEQHCSQSPLLPGGDCRAVLHIGDWLL